MVTVLCCAVYSPSITDVHLEHQNVTLFGNKASADVRF